MIILKRQILILFLLAGFQVYSQKHISEKFSKTVDKAVKALNVKSPPVSDPVSVNTTLVYNDDKSQLAVIVKAKILQGWHIYAYVPKTEPYIQYKMILDAPKTLTALTEWSKPGSYPYEDNVFVYKGEVVFTRYYSVKGVTPGSKISAGLAYQTCDIRQCLPPNTKVKELKL